MTAKQRAARAKFKAVVKEASKLRKKNPKLTQAQAVKQAWAISYSKKSAGVGAAPKKKATPTKVKAKKSKRTSEMHTDTKSHNVNIRVVSGIESNVVEKYKAVQKNINSLEGAIIRNLETSKKFQYQTPFWQQYLKKENKKIRDLIKELKKHKSELKKLL